MNITQYYITLADNDCETLNFLKQLGDKMAENQVQLEASLTTISAQLSKALVEINDLRSEKEVMINNLTAANAELVARIGELEAAVLNTTISDQAQAALDSIKGLTQIFDDIVPDVVPVSIV